MAHNEKTDDAQDDVSPRLKPARGLRLTAFVEGFVASQRSTLRLIAFLSERQEEVDGYKARLRGDMGRRYPELPKDKLDELLSIVDGALDQHTRPPHDIVSDVVAAVGSDYYGTGFLHDFVRVSAQPPTVPRMLGSLLMTMVADFEVFIARLMSLHIESNPAVLMGSERKFTWREVSSGGSIEDFLELVSERAVEDLMRDSMKAWLDYLESRFDVRIPEVGRSTALAEIVQRRHLIVHADAVVNRDYLEHLPRLVDPPQLGDRLQVDEVYLRHAADRLLECVYGLAANSAKKISEEDRLAFVEGSLVNEPYRLLQDGRFEVAARICGTYANAQFHDDENQLIMRINHWLALKLGGEFHRCADDVRGWSTTALRPRYRLVRLALLDRNDEALALVQLHKGTDELPMHFWLTWPILAGVRAHERDASGPEMALIALTEPDHEAVGSTQMTEGTQP